MSKNNCDIESIVAPSSKIVAEFRNIVADIEDFIKDAAVLSGDELTNAGTKLGERVSGLQKSIGDISESVSERAQQGIAATNEYAREQPWAMIGAGAALGLVLGVILTRRN